MIASCYVGGRSEVGSGCNGLEAVLVGDLKSLIALESEVKATPFGCVCTAAGRLAELENGG